MFKIINVSAVPFNLARLQSNTTKNIFQRTAEISSSQSSNNEIPIFTSIQNICDSSQRQTTCNSSAVNDRMAKKRNKILRNRFSAKVSREKLKLHRDLLEKQLENLKLEKMRLFVENEELRLRHSQLKEENLSLKKKWEEKHESEDALKHAEGMGSSSCLDLPFHEFDRDIELLSVATVPDIPCLKDLPDFEDMLEIGDSSNFYELQDVFLCSTSQDLTKATFADTHATARIICQEIEVSCQEEETSTIADISEKMEEAMEIFDTVPSLPHQWTFDNLYEDMVENISLNGYL